VSCVNPAARLSVGEPSSVSFSQRKSSELEPRESEGPLKFFLPFELRPSSRTPSQKPPFDAKTWQMVSTPCWGMPSECTIFAIFIGNDNSLNIEELFKFFVVKLQVRFHDGISTKRVSKHDEFSDEVL
jgi:hypothetical protein